ncbi:hypothetical protein CIB48_g1532 [Xylaria polymorpha]|nr:hypothetical protein CIB48_g1532 [Xylaria polymorpha]
MSSEKKASRISNGNVGWGMGRLRVGFVLRAAVPSSRLYISCRRHSREVAMVLLPVQEFKADGICPPLLSYRYCSSTESNVR